MISLVILASAFVSGTAEDPITGRKTAIYAVTDRDSTLALSCEPGTNSLSISVVPDRYYGPGPGIGLWAPVGVHRFKSQSKPSAGDWYFQQEHISFLPKGLSTIKGTAEFLNTLANDASFSIRYEIPPGSVKTITIEYTLEHDDLRSFISKCNPRKVIERLKEMNSLVAP